jgi:hypothetical protein
MKYPLVECSTFADLIKKGSGIFQKTWHYVDHPLVNPGDDIKNYKPEKEEHNIIEALNVIVAWFRNEK